MNSYYMLVRVFKVLGYKVECTWVEIFDDVYKNCYCGLSVLG